jgi:uncharacterized protein YoxC
MHLRVALTVVDIVLLALILAFFVIRITSGLQSIANSLGQVSDGVVAIERDTSILSSGADTINSNLGAAAQNLTAAVGHAQALARG